MIVAWLAAAGGRCIQQSDISTREVSVHLNSIESLNGGFLTVTLPTGPEVFAGLGGWAYY